MQNEQLENAVVAIETITENSIKNGFPPPAPHRFSVKVADPPPAQLQFTSHRTNVATATPPPAAGRRGSVPRRRFQTGTFVKNGANWMGLWREDVLKPDGSVGRVQRSKTFVGLSERAARAAFQPILDVVNAANKVIPPIPHSTATLSKLVAEWREQIASTYKPSTRHSAESHLRCHIEPMLGDCALPELNAKRIQEFVTGLSGGTRVRKTIENILLTLSSIIAAGRAWGYAIPKFSFSGLRLPQGKVGRARCFAFEEMSQIVRAAPEPLATICYILSVTGMRIGEVLALRLEDLDFRRKLVKVRCSAYAGQIGTPKSAASVADLPMPAPLEARLHDYLESHHYRKNDAGLLFANRRGRPYSADKLREKKLRPLLVQLHIPLAGFHAFRHAVASVLIDSGAPITVVQAQLRHSDPRITLGLYGHVVPQSQRNAVGDLADRLGQLLSQAGNA